MLHTPAPLPDVVTLATGLGLARGRTHEIAGPARRAMALLIAARMQGPMLWIAPSWGDERLMGDGVSAFLEPARLIFASARTPAELLWAAEEGARSGAVGLVAVELPEPPALTPVRRLHLAAEDGAARGAAPVVLLLTPGDGGAAGVETRWRAEPAPGWARDGQPRWRVERRRARLDPPGAWELRRAGDGLAASPLPMDSRPTEFLPADFLPTEFLPTGSPPLELRPRVSGAATSPDPTAWPTGVAPTLATASTARPPDGSRRR